MPKKKSTQAKPRVRTAVIGVGGMGTGHCLQMRQRVRELNLVAVCDIDPETAEHVGKKFRVPHFTSHKDLIKADICDAVTIATPHPSHSPIAVACMKAGLHVLTEKPLSENISTAEKMVKAARENDVTFAVMFQRRFSPAWSKALEIARSGLLGPVLRATMISPEYRSQAYYDSGGWRATWEGEGGGVMMNQSPHILDLFVHLSGMPIAVRGRTETRVHNIEVEDFAEATLTFPDGGSGYFYCSTNEVGPGQMIEIFGDCGKLIMRDGNLQVLTYDKPIREVTHETGEKWGRPEQTEMALKLHKRKVGHFSVLRNFARHILNGEDLVTPGESGLQSLELANAVMLSSYLDKEIKIPISRRAYNKLLKSLREESTFKKNNRKVNLATDPEHIL